MNPPSSGLEWLHLLGTYGAGAATFVVARARAVTKQASDAVRIARAVRSEMTTFAETMKVEIADLRRAFEDLKAGTRLAFDDLKLEVHAATDTAERAERKSSPDAFLTIEGIRQRFEDLGHRLANVERQIEDIRQQISRDRGQRHALQQEFHEYVRTEASKWTDLLRSVSRIEGYMEAKK